MAALELIKDAGLAPRRTIRLVLWGAEEVGLLGANAYRERHEAELTQHVMGSKATSAAEGGVESDGRQPD